MHDQPLESIIGQRITEVDAPDEEDWIRLTLEDGRRVEFEGMGYDGLWQKVLFGIETPERSS